MIFVYRGPALPLVTRTSAEISPFMFFNSSLIQDGSSLDQPRASPVNVASMLYRYDATIWEKASCGLHL